MSENNEKGRLNAYVDKETHEFVKLLTEKSKMSQLEICNTLILNGIDTFLQTASKDFKNVDFQRLHKWVNRFSLKNEMASIMIFNKTERRAKTNE